MSTELERQRLMEIEARTDELRRLGGKHPNFEGAMDMLLMVDVGWLVRQAQALLEVKELHEKFHDNLRLENLEKAPKPNLNFRCLVDC